VQVLLGSPVPPGYIWGTQGGFCILHRVSVEIFGAKWGGSPLEVKSLRISCHKLVTQEANTGSRQTSGDHIFQGRAFTIQI